MRHHDPPATPGTCPTGNPNSPKQCDWFVDGDTLTLHTSREQLRSLWEALREIEWGPAPGVTHLLVGDCDDVGTIDAGESLDGRPIRRVSVFVWH